MDTTHNVPNTERNILLALLPFWTPLIPPMGISCLKSYLQRCGFNNIKLVDCNTEVRFRLFYTRYFHILAQQIPSHRQGNLFNIGHDLLEHHMMAHLHFTNEHEYIDLVMSLIANNFYCTFDRTSVIELNNIIARFFVTLKEYLIALLEREHPSVLGLSVCNHTLSASLFAFRIAKERLPRILTVMGGPVFSQGLNRDSVDFHSFLEQTPYIDNIIIGEGELLLSKLLQNELPTTRKVHSLDDLDGRLLDLSSLHVPDYSDLDLHYYHYVGSYASRGCPFHCSFCSETKYWGTFRKKKATQIVKELIELSERYNYQLFLLCDSMLNPVIDELSDELINTDKSIYWDAYLRADNRSADNSRTLKWRSAGFYRARLGIESGSQHTLDLMHKQINTSQITKSISSLAYAGIKTTTYWVVGHPGETEEDFHRTLNLLEEMKDNIYEAECNHFNYYLTGQVDSNLWTNTRKAISLYPEEYNKILMIPTWTLDVYPTRELVFERVNRFVEHCNKLLIPNPYSIPEIMEADKRWQKLHKNSVPPLVDFMDRDKYVNENKYVCK